jgi:hypothetical protein
MAGTGATFPSTPGAQRVLETSLISWRQKKIFRVSREEVHKMKEMIKQLILIKNIILTCILFGTVTELPLDEFG